MGRVLACLVIGGLWTWLYFIGHRDLNARVYSGGHLGLQFLLGTVGAWLALLFWSWLSVPRGLLDWVFRKGAFVITLGCLAMLVFFLASLGRDAYHWFEAMPGEVAKHNARLKDEAENYAAREWESLRRQMEADIASGADAAEQEAIRREWQERVLPRKQIEVKEIAAAKRRLYEEETRTDLSGWGLFRHFVTHGPAENDSPQNAGILPALLGSLYLGLITLIVAIPLGVGAAIYLEEYRATGWLNRVIQVNISNLAAVPSVFYGIVGAWIFVDTMFAQIHGLRWTPAFLVWMVGPDSAQTFMSTVFGDKVDKRNLLAGGLTLGLLTLPVVIVSAQEAIRAVPVSLRHGALALGATKWQATWSVVLPQARGGILTGVILALSRALGEAAPLVMFGALTFVNYNPALLTPFTVMPLQIFNWTDRPQDLWHYNAGMASLLLMGLLLMLNAVAIWLRQRSRKTAGQT
ncbi:MAG TPA: ABC transporter permease subunit [Gemmatales bacterium]|nr:ABC transporter permease subunit [Gemmatales bacterium]HMP58758.1 ABC transporter permease subunit [Gemmatales bacterium]